ncbi:6-carboxytetrahydropterin synthase [Bdellovibrionales bacterium]|nr:6-carboxytetrahydropterin synthase [Bdellovibrionales bacterium]
MVRRLFIRNLTNLDFAWLDAKRGLMGESLQVSVALEGEMDERGFIMDFGPCKRWIKDLIDTHLDHMCVVPTHSAAVNVLGIDEERLSFGFRWQKGELEYECPRETVVLLEEEQLTLNSFSTHLERIALQQLPERVQAIKISLSEDPLFRNAANYRYTHGLKLHEGNCQRLFHGHRNPVEIFTNNVRQEKMEVFLCDYFKQIHFVPKSSIVSETGKLVMNSRDLSSKESLTIRYQAPQGVFSSEMPVCDCLVMEEEPSIERITELAWSLIKKEFAISDSTSLTISCFEGLSKGCSYGN